MSQIFYFGIKTKTQIKNLRHSSLRMNVIDLCWKFYFCDYDISRDIHVQKIKVEQ